MDITAAALAALVSSMVRYENERRCWGKHSSAAAGRPCTGCAWLIKYKYSEPHVDRQTEKTFLESIPVLTIARGAPPALLPLLLPRRNLGQMQAEISVLVRTCRMN